MSKRSVPVQFDESAIDALFADLNQCHYPGATVGIAIDGTPVYRKAFGLASRELPLTLSPSMRMRLGSNSKHFSALAYMLLCEEERVGLDDTIEKHFPELHPVIHKVTMRQLMGNIGGLREICDLVVQFSGVEGHPLSCSELVSYYRDISDVNASPGSTFIYCNGGWMILCEIIERISQQPLETFLWERVFEPIGMYETMLRRWNVSFVPNSASPHVITKAGDYVRTENWGGIDGSGSTSIVSTVDDMLRWMAHMDVPKVGNARTWKTMLTPQTLANGKSSNYGLGLFVLPYRGVMTVQHAGGMWGANMQMLKVPDAGLDVVVLVNRSDKSGMELADNVLDACLPGLDPAKPVFRGPCATGVFRSPKTGRVVQLLADETYENSPETAQVAAVDGHHICVHPGTDGVLRPVNPTNWIQYELTLIGHRERPTSIRLNDFGNLDELVALDASVKTDVREIVGCYRSDTTGVEVTISAGENPRMRAVGRFGTATHNIEFLADGVWRSWPQNELALPPWAFLVFEKDLRSFRFCGLLTRNVWFRRVD